MVNRDNDWFFDQFDSKVDKRMDNFDRNFKRGAKAIIGVWVAAALLGIAFWAVVIWGIIELVQHFTAN